MNTFLPTKHSYAIYVYLTNECCNLNSSNTVNNLTATLCAYCTQMVPRGNNHIRLKLHSLRQAMLHFTWISSSYLVGSCTASVYEIREGIAGVQIAEHIPFMTCQHDSVSSVHTATSSPRECTNLSRHHWLCDCRVSGGFMNINKSKRTTLSSVRLTAAFFLFSLCATYKNLHHLYLLLEFFFLNDKHDRQTAQAHQLLKPTCTHENGITTQDCYSVLMGLCSQTQVSRLVCMRGWCR